MFERQLTIQLPEQQSAFLWGARQTGKSYYLKHHFWGAIYYDLLDTHELARLTKSRYLLREEILATNPKCHSLQVVIDEIQKVPILLNEVHWLIENYQVQFILCSSSARKLTTQSTNLLGGRAFKHYMFPLSASEIPNFDLLKALQHGLLPQHYLAQNQLIDDYLQAYIDTYLTDEIRNEGLVRNLGGFAQFLDIAGMNNGAMLNMNNIARDCGVSRSTVQGYYQILVDTLLGYFIRPYHKRSKRELITAAPKFYLFDVGLANYLAGQYITALKGSVAGQSFEHWVLMELMAYKHYTRQHRSTIYYWRTKNGLEVDFILGEAQTAMEVKISQQVKPQDIKGLIAFCRDHPHTNPIVVSQDKQPRKLTIDQHITVTVLPWQQFIKQLWQGEIQF